MYCVIVMLLVMQHTMFCRENLFHAKYKKEKTRYSHTNDQTSTSVTFFNLR